MEALLYVQFTGNDASPDGKSRPFGPFEFVQIVEDKLTANVPGVVDAALLAVREAVVGISQNGEDQSITERPMWRRVGGGSGWYWTGFTIYSR